MTQRDSGSLAAIRERAEPARHGWGTWVVRVGGVAAIAGILFAPPRSGVWAQSAAQSATAGTGVIAGRIVDGTTGAAVTGVVVTLSHQGPAPTGPSPAFDPTAPRMSPASQQSGTDGRFEFTGLPAGLFGLRVPNAPGYQSGYFGMQAPADSTGSNTRLTLRVDDRLTDLVFNLWRVGSVSGRVTDERNEPVVRGTVHLLAREFVAGRPAWIRWRLPAQTDDRGAFTVTNVTAGSYLVALAGHRSETGPMGYDPVFHPSSRTAAGAAVVTIGAGEARADVNITATFTPTARVVSVSGRVAGTPSPVPRMLLRLVQPEVDDSLIDFESLTTMGDADGGFSFPRVPVGEYRLVTSMFPALERGIARGGGVSSFDGFSMTGGPPGGVVPLPEAPTWVLDQPMTVDRPIENLDVTARAGARIRGRLVFDADGPAPGAESLRSMLITVRSAYMRQLGDVPFGGVEPDGRFQTVGLPPGGYVLTPRPPLRPPTELTGWYVRSVRVGGRETIGEAIELGASDLADVELVLTKRPVELSGMVRTADGRPAAWARVFLFPRDRALWGHYLAFPAPRRIRQIVTDRFGEFRGAGVPPGEYQMAAVVTVPEFWMAPEFLETRVGSAVPLTVQPGDTRVMYLTIKD